MRHPAICLLSATAIAFGLIPAALAGPAAHAPDRGQPVALLQALSHGGVRSTEGARPGPLLQPHQLLLSSDAPRGLPALVDAQKTVLDRAWDGPVADLRSLIQETEPGPAGTAPDGRVRVPMTASDVNADGREDAIFFDIGIDENGFRIEAAITALDGVSGAGLWSRSYGNPYNILVLSPRDVTGDGSDDLFVIVLEQEREENGPAGNGPGRPYDTLYRYEWELAVLSGAQGTDAWQRSFQGSLRYQGVFAGQGPGLVEYAHITGDNALVDVRRSEDLDGDGLSDFTLNVHDYEREFFYSNWVQEMDRYVYATQAEALTGDTGSTLLTKTQSDQPGAAFLLPLGEATGDGRADLLWTFPTLTSTPTICPQIQPCIEDQSVELHLELVDLGSTSAGWENDVIDEGVIAAEPLVTGSDLTGDGRADILVGLTLEDGTQRVLAVSGSNGQRAWIFDTIISAIPTLIGSLDRGPGTDLMFWEGEDVFEDEAPTWFRIRLRRVDGSTGHQLFSTERELVDEETNIDSIFANAIGDVNADGVPDIAHATWHSTGYWEATGSASSVLAVESGATGQELLHAVRDRNALLFTGGDLVPGGPEDLLEGSVPYDNTNFRLRGIEMPSGRALWSHTDVLFTAYFTTLRNRVGAGDDILYARDQVMQEAPKRRSRLDLLGGDTGLARWGVGPDLVSAAP